MLVNKTRIKLIYIRLIYHKSNFTAYFVVIVVIGL